MAQSDKPSYLLADPHYSHLKSLKRCMHFDDFYLCKTLKKMHSCRFSKRSWLSDVGNVLWFSPSLSSTDVHNQYGNVSFIIDMDSVISRFGDKFYFYDGNEFQTHSSSRVLLTTNNFDGCLTPIDSRFGSPVKKLHGWNWQYATQYKSDRYDTIVPHFLEIAIAVDDSDCEWLYRTIEPQVNDHSLANTSNGKDSLTCNRYNTRCKMCPFKLAKSLITMDLSDIQGILQTVKL